MAGAGEVSAQQRDGEQAIFGEKAELERDGGQYDGSIHIAGVIGYEHVAAFGIELFEADHAAVDRAYGEQHARPFLRDAMLGEAGAVTQRCQKGNGAHQDGGGDDRGCGKEGCSDFPHNNEVRMKVETLLSLAWSDGMKAVRCIEWKRELS
jgi:hypothetical protein